MKERIQVMKQENEKNRQKLMKDMSDRQSQRTIEQRQSNSMIKLKLAEVANDGVEEKKQLTARIKYEKDLARSLRKSQEREYVEALKYQYHLDRKQKLDSMRQTES